jgi:hypothetical protein
VFISPPFMALSTARKIKRFPPCLFGILVIGALAGQQVFQHPKRKVRSLFDFFGNGVSFRTICLRFVQF